MEVLILDILPHKLLGFTTDIASSITVNETKVSLIIGSKTMAKAIAWNFMQNGICIFYK